jgi:alcohol dehydrogenase
MQPFDFHPRTRVVFREGGLSLIGELAQSLGFARTLIVADPGMLAAGLVDRTAASLQAAAIVTCGFHEFDVNPDSAMVEAGRRVAAEAGVDSIVAVGGGSSLDCAKGINFVLTSGGSMRDYRGYGKAVKPMLPMIGIPTTAGTGSDAQSYAIISDPATHEKMACGDPGAAFRIALLDPSVTITQPRRVSATAGYDAISHAVESFVTTRRSSISDMFALSAWRLLHANYQQVLEHPSDVNARGGMLIGAHQAGAAIEQSMLGATHACANPLTARYGTTHGDAIAIMLPHVVRWNAVAAGEKYAELLRSVGVDGGERPGATLALRLEALRHAGGLPSSLHEAGVVGGDLEALASDAAKQWTGTFNPRPFDAAAALELYERAF